MSPYVFIFVFLCGLSVAQHQRRYRALEARFRRYVAAVTPIRRRFSHGGEC